MKHAATIALVLALSPAAHAQPSSADLVKSAKAHFDVQEYADAERDLKDAYKLDPKPEILYALAQAQRMAGECDRAIVSYKNFLRTNPRADLAKLAQDNIDTCVAKPEPPPHADTPPPHVDAPPPHVDTPPPPPRVAPSPNWTGRVLIAGGALALAGGGYLAYHAQQDIDAVANAKFYDDFLAAQKTANSAKTTRTIGIVTAGAGAALVIAGIVSYVVRSSPESPAVAVGPHGEIGVAWGF